MNYHFRIAASETDRDRVHALNYLVFVEEIGQHPANSERRLVDRFHAENTYFLCLWGEDLAGMLCARDQRPFSLDAKLPGLDSLMPPHRRVVEIRLLAVKREHRSPQVFRGLLRLMAEYCAAQGYDLAVVSAYTGQMELYRHIGFRPFGPRVGKEPAFFQPMFLTPKAAADVLETIDRSLAESANYP